MLAAMSRAARIALGSQYALLIACGSWLMAEPTVVLSTAMGKVVYGWAAFMLFGGILSLLSIITKLWVGEFTGLILLWFANVMWGLALIVPSLRDLFTSFEAPSHNGAKYGLALLAWSAGYAARWLQIKRKVQRAVQAASDLPPPGRGADG